MSYNPLTAECAAKRRELKNLKAKWQTATEDLKWHARFDEEAAQRSLRRETAKIAALERDRSSIEEQVAATKREIADLQRQAKLGWDPRQWLSRDRGPIKRSLEGRSLQLKELQADLRTVKRSLRPHVDDRQVASTELARYHGIDPVRLKSLERQLASDIALGQVALEDLNGRRRMVDKQLEAPLRTLNELNAEATKFSHELEAATEFEKRLTDARNSYEKAMVHSECELVLGDGSPRKVIIASQRKLASLERNIEKVEHRLSEIGRRASRDIRAIIVDGNNLCYQDSTFIGLSALRPLVAQIAQTRDVTVVFDSSIRRHLHIRDDDLRSLLPQSTVHVVAPKRQADETILDAAHDPQVYVISNDRYAEFREKPAVSDDRILRHEIINGLVLVPDLGIRQRFGELP